MIGRRTDTMRTERLYALCAYSAAVTVVALGACVVSLMVEQALMSAAWQIVLVCMAIPLLAALAVACGNNREFARLRALTWWIVAPLGLLNPLAWLGLRIILTRPPRGPEAHSHAAGD